MEMEAKGFHLFLCAPCGAYFLWVLHRKHFRETFTNI